VPASVQTNQLDGWWEPAEAFDALYRDSRNLIWLDAGPTAATGFSYLAVPTERSRAVTASVESGTVTLTRPGDPGEPAVTLSGTIFDFLRNDLAVAGVDGSSAPGQVRSADSGFGGGFRLGWVGWLGYELGAQTLGTPVRASRYPDAALLEIDRMLAFDHRARTVTLVSRRAPGEPARLAEEWAAWLRARFAARREREHPEPDAPQPTATPMGKPPGMPPGMPPNPPEPRWRHDATRYAELIRHCQASIAAGDAYQLCLTNEIRVDVRPDPADAYLRLRAGSPSHHGGLLRFGDLALLSASPEQFLTVTHAGAVSTRPIKGTRPRSQEPGQDAALRAELAASEKERAENLMIVDLMRNDLSRVAALGSVAVTGLLDVESYAHVHQLVSTIEARLAAGVTGTDAVESCFPAGSMTGAPKRSAVTLLHELEAGPRGIYAGAFGFFGRDGALDLAMVIRSIVLDPSGASVGTGGGITALSDPVEEIEETRIKAAALLAVLGLPANRAPSHGPVT
jgi:para-aminobenzoate synthetase component I